MGLTGIFDYNQAVTLGQFQDRIHVGHLPIKMDWNHGRDRAAASAAYQSAGIVDRALLFKILAKLCGVHVVGPLVDVHELGQRAGLRDRFGGGDEGMRYCDHDVAGLHSTGHKSKAQSVGPTAYGNGMVGLAEGCERLLEVFDHRAADKASRPQSFVKNFRQFLLKFNVGSNQIEKRNGTRSAIRNAHFKPSGVCSVS